MVLGMRCRYVDDVNVRVRQETLIAVVGELDLVPGCETWDRCADREATAWIGWSVFAKTVAAKSSAI